MSGRKSKDLSGMQFGWLLALNATDLRGSDGSVIWKCICKCGNTKYVSSSKLLRGNKKGAIQSCGCYRHSKEHAANLSKILKGREVSDEFRDKMSKLRLENNYMKGRFGPSHHFYGGHHSPESCELISSKLKGRKIPIATVEKITIKITGKTRSAESKLRLSASKQGCLNPSWKGGISFEPYCPKFDTTTKESIRDLFNRTCYLCGKPEYLCKYRLSIHHVDYNKSQGCSGKYWSLIPLCNSCHTKTNANRWYWFGLLRDYWISYKYICFFTNDWVIHI